ncbi:centrosomal protein of 112 kDa isoform X7 [Ahaetulla prasina]|uniref:centrosomal protein of 112 kDa isoform X7 n=1 Tax=Ahaetulla prasina TaxID=499056 RepID=UPI002649E6A7|nr:centrosomal protein of 112 kDa isoform X7 [Ahaetulla prasina]
MSSEEEAWEKLDSEFDHYVVDMKSYVLKLPHKSERYRCAVWIKKFCEPSGAGTGIVGRKNRNLYAKLLLHMLKRGVLEGPFTQKPESGILKTLPSYMSIYFDEPSSKRAWSNIPEDVRDWVMEELGQSDHKPDESWKLSFKEESALVSTPSKQREQFTCNGKLALRSHSTSPPHLSEDETLPSNTKGDCYRRKTSFDDSDFEARLNSWNLGLENPRYLREKPMSLSLMSPKFGLGKNSTSRDEQALLRIHEKELEMKSKLMEARLHEEKLKLQQRHDADVQKILDRKNNEIDVLKSLYRTKQNEAEETIQKLEKKVQTLVRESQVIREAQEKQILELKKLCEHSTDSLNNEWEKKLHNAVAEMEKDKFNLQKKHTENIQELLEDTNARLSKMEAEYLAETKTTNQMVKELEARVHQLTVEAETSYLQHQKLSQEKNNLEQSYQSASLELEEIKARYNSLQKERGRMMEEHKQNIKQLQSKYEVDLNLMKKEHALSAMKTSDVTEDLKQCVSELKQQLLESDHQRQQQLQEQEQMFLQEKADLERIHDKKIYEIQSDFDKERIESHKKIRKLEDLLREREEHLTQVMEAQRLQAQQADAALEEFKRQVELNSEKVYAEMKEQMEKVEADLNKSKSFREKQSKEFSWQLEELKQKHEQQIICDMEAQIHSLREELIQVNTQRKQQLVELSLLREEEKQRAARDHETTMNKVKAESEKMILDLKKTNAAEKEMALEKKQKQIFQELYMANGKLKQIEKEYNQKLAKSSQIIAELKTTISSLTEESNQRQLAGERRLQDVLQKFEDEKQQLIRDNDTAIKGLQDEIESYHNQVQSAEEKLQQKDLEAQEQVTSIRQEYETKLKGLMPASLRQELEDTILSLKSQVNFLRKRASILQDELSTYRTRR